MNSFKENFRIAKPLLLYSLIHLSRRKKKPTMNGLMKIRSIKKLAKRILNEETYERNTQLIKSFSSQKAWDRIYPLLGGEKSSGFLSWRKV